MTNTGRAVRMNEACHQLGVSKVTFRKLLKKGKFPNAFQLETEWRIPQADIDSFKGIKPARVLDEGERGPWVYFVEAEGFNSIKIGWTAGPPKMRLDMLQTGCPAPLRILAAIPGTEAKEQAIHDKFAHIRQRGEWFEATTELRDYIKNLSEKHTTRKSSGRTVAAA